MAPMTLEPLRSKPLVSVLTATHNAAGHLERSAASVAGQTYDRLEHIVVDDGSSDDTVDTLERLAVEHRHLRFASIEHGGQTAAMNEAFALARGDVILFLDADDEFVPEKTQRCIEAFQSRPTAGLLTHKIAEVTPSGDQLSVFPPYSSVADGWLGERALSRGGEISGLSATSAMAIRRPVAEVVFPFPTTVDMAYFDVLLHGLAPLLTEIIGIDDALSHYLWHGENLTFADGLAPARVEHRLELHRRVWHLQHDLLLREEPLSAARLRPFEDSRFAGENAYLLARLRQDRLRAGSAHRRLRSSVSFPEQPVPRRVFWLIAPLLPDRMFISTMQAMMSPGGLRKMVGYVRQLQEKLMSGPGRSLSGR